MLEFREKENGIDILYSDRNVYSFTRGNIALYAGKGKNNYQMSHGSFKISEKLSEKTELSFEYFKLSGDKAVIDLSEGRLTAEIQCGKRIFFHFDGLEKYNRLWIRLPALKDEYIYGGGEIFSEFDLRGKRINVWVAEHINALQVARKLIERTAGIKNNRRKQKFSNYETYYAQPTFLSSRKYYFHSLTTARAEGDFTHSDYHEIKTDEIADFYICFGDTFEALSENLTELTGRQPPLPDWTYDGEILGVQGGTDIMLKKAEAALSYGAEVNGIWIQDWEGRRVTAVGKQLLWNWEWDRELYPELDEKIKELREKGIRVLSYCNPFLALGKPLYNEASEKGYCVKNYQGEDYLVTITTFPAAMVDLTNPEAYEWIKGIIKRNIIDMGFSGWMADFGEYLPTDCILYSGENPEYVHNTWPARWAKVNREAVEESGKLGEIMFFTRAGYTGTGKYSTMMWNGDNHVDFSIDFGLPSVIPAMLSLSCCGFGLSHSDIGGYTTFFNLKRSEELYMRWCEMNAFSPLMRGHEGLNPDLNAQLDASEDVLLHGAKMSRIHKALKPYLKNAAEYNAEKGVGIVRPLFYYYDEKEAYEECYEYLLGRDILVAPVLNEGEVRREVYLPEDRWIHLENKKEYGGGHHTVYAPIGEIPVFVRKDAPKWVRSITDNLFGGKNK